MSRGYHRRLERSIGVNNIAREGFLNDQAIPSGDGDSPMPADRSGFDASFSEEQKSSPKAENYTLK